MLTMKIIKGEVIRDYIAIANNHNIEINKIYFYHLIKNIIIVLFIY